MSKFLKLMEGWNGFAPVGGGEPTAEMAAAIRLLANDAKFPQYRHRYLLQEAITTSQFPNLFGQILQRQILARYKAALAEWRPYVKVTTVPDFNLVYRHKVYGNTTVLPLVEEKGEYLVAAMAEASYNYRVYKRGRQFDISWESLINDSMGAMQDIPARWAEAAIKTEAYIVTDLFVAATGPDTGLFGAGITDVDGQVVTNLGTLPLSIANLQTTLQLMSSQTDQLGDPISVRGVHLVVPPALEFTARQILTSAQMQWTEVGAGGGVPVPTTNIIPQVGMKLHVDPMIPVIDVSANVDTTWYVFAEPSQGVALEVAHLRGHETPEICMKASDKVTLGGGSLNPLTGDFATDNVFYRIRHVFGGRAMDPRFAYAQDGSA